MEFDEIKKIWDGQNNRPLYTIDESAMHNRILSKKKQAYHITNTSELLWIIVSLGGSASVLVMNILKHNENIFMYLLSAWMLAMALYMLLSRLRRIKASRRFDRSMRGELDHAIAVATYQERLSLLGRWNVLPMGIILVLGIGAGGGKPLWWIGGLILCLALVSYAAGWEHKIYKARKRELEVLREKLD
jgi:hypothetical protein